MGIEIERKFLVKNDSWRVQAYRSERISQGYLMNEKRMSIRIRSTDGQSWLTIKGSSSGNGLTRAEYEYPIPQEDAEHLLKKMCTPPLIEKTRYWVRHGLHIWEIDVFEGDNEGLVVAEVELGCSDESVDLPRWVGEEVSSDPRYLNASLVHRPYCHW